MLCEKVNFSKLAIVLSECALFVSSTCAFSSALPLSTLLEQPAFVASEFVKLAAVDVGSQQYGNQILTVNEEDTPSISLQDFIASKEMPVSDFVSIASHNNYDKAIISDDNDVTAIAAEQTKLDISTPTTITDIEELNINSYNDDIDASTPSIPLQEESQKVEEELVVDKVQIQAQELKYVDVTLQVVDDRSTAKGDLYPIDYVNVQLLGLDLIGTTDNTGRLVIKDLPVGSRYIVLIDDHYDRIRSSVVEIQVSEESSKNILIKVLRNIAFELYEQLVQDVQRSDKSSLCGHVANNSLQQKTLANYSVYLDVAANGPYFFNERNMLDSKLSKTSANGRFCFFNVESELATINFYKEVTDVTTIPFEFVMSRHNEEKFYIQDKTQFSTYLTSVPSAAVQLQSSEYDMTNDMNFVNQADVIALGSTTSLVKNGDYSFRSLENNITSYQNKFTVLASGNEFESALYTFDSSSDRKEVLPLMPRGFIDDLALFSNNLFDASLGVVVVNTLNESTSTNDQVQFRLVSLAGSANEDVWYYAAQPLTKAIFFNVQPGKYLLFAEDSSGNLLHATTVLVYNETVSYVKTGFDFVATHN